MKLSDLPDDVVFLFVVEGDWNLHGGDELLEDWKKEHKYTFAILAGGDVKKYWFNIEDCQEDSNFNYEMRR